MKSVGKGGEKKLKSTVLVNLWKAESLTRCGALTVPAAEIMQRKQKMNHQT